MKKEEFGPLFMWPLANLTIRAIFSDPEPSDGFESFPASANRKHSSGLTLDEREPPVDGRHSEEKVRTNLGPSYPAGASPKAD